MEQEMDNDRAMVESEADKLYVIPEGSSDSTFKDDENLPNMPVPSLEATVAKYLESLKPFVSSEQLAKTERLAKKFLDGEGKVLQAKLMKKASTEKNWLEKWWEDYGYLSNRTPLIPFCNMDGVFYPEDLGFKTENQEDQIKNGALFLHYILDFWKLLRDEKLQPAKTADKKSTFSMSQFRRLFNTTRVPGLVKDELVCHFKTASEGSCPSHIVILRRGRLFKMDVIDNDGSLLTAPELAAAFRSLIEETEKNPATHSVPLLTCDERTSWSKNRSRLMSQSAQNTKSIQDIETAIAVISLDVDSPPTISDTTSSNLCGDLANRWADKSVNSIIYRNGQIGGICDHTAFDGIISVGMMHYAYLRLLACGGGWKGRLDVRPGAAQMQEIKFDLDNYIRQEIERVQRDSELNRKEVVMTRNAFTHFGKTEIRELKLHPDSFVQMALQLAYLRLYKKPAPCYETATTRGYYNGRTETVRSCSQECFEWASAMLNSKVTASKKRDLLKMAVTKHDKLMADARENAGCDRHLFGLYCTALEEGLPVPELYSDESYALSGGGANYVLSTSLTGYTPIGGGVAPMCVDGYGVFYCILPKKICITVSTNSKSSVTNPLTFFNAISSSLREMRDLMREEYPVSKL